VADENLSIKFGADTSGVTAGAGAVKTVLGGIQTAAGALAAGFRQMASGASEGFARIAEGAAASSVSLKAAGAAAQVHESIAGLGQAFHAAFAIEKIADVSKQLAENAEQTQHVAQTLGLTTQQVQQLKAQATGLGVPFEAFTSLSHECRFQASTRPRGDKLRRPPCSKLDQEAGLIELLRSAKPRTRPAGRVGSAARQPSPRPGSDR
jgi:hypothetical protein